MKRLFIVGNDAFIINAMRLALRYSSSINLFGVMDGDNVREAVREAQPDIVVVDGLQNARLGIDHLREIREAAPQALALLLSAPLEHPALHEVLEAGALVCLSASTPVAEPAPLFDAPQPEAPAVAAPAPVAAAPAAGNDEWAARDADILEAAGRSPLTSRELEILRAVAEGHTNARIGRQLWVTEQTVKFHLSNIFRKLGVTNRTEASRYALVNGLASLPGRAPARTEEPSNGHRLVGPAN